MFTSFFKGPTLYHDIENFPHLFLNYIVKRHDEYVAENRKSVIERYCDSRRCSLGLQDIRREVFVF